MSTAKSLGDEADAAQAPDGFAEADRKRKEDMDAGKKLSFGIETMQDAVLETILSDISNLESIFLRFSLAVVDKTPT